MLHIQKQAWTRMGFIVAAFVAILLLGHTAVGQAQDYSGSNGTIPGQLTEIRGQVTEADESVIEVCGHEFLRWDGTQEHTRFGPLGQGAFVRVLATYGMDQNLYANRIQVLDPQSFVRIRGILRAMDSDTPMMVVDGIAVDASMAHTAGQVVVGQRVDIKATVESCTAEALVATFVVGKALPGAKKHRPVMVSGKVTSIVEGDGVSTWTIDVEGGDDFVVLVDSALHSVKKSVSVGTKIKVFALEQDDGSYIAKKVIVIPGNGPNK